MEIERGAAKVIETLTVKLIDAIEALPDKLVKGLPDQRERIATAVLAALASSEGGLKGSHPTEALDVADNLINELRGGSD